MKKLVTKFAQNIADFLYERLEESLGKEEFNTWFTAALYLDFYCVKNDIYLD
jgi:hypothetical protein